MTQSKQLTGRFNDLKIEENFLTILARKGFNVLTPIQHQVIPDALQGKDVIGIAQTGTGKTLAFCIPMMQRIAQYKGQGLILVPTRELALQVERALKNIGASMGMRSAVIIGGTSKHTQIRDLKRSPHIVVATPGRLIDLMNQKAYALNQVNTIILDEADRMLDVGFLPQIKRILQVAPKERQTMLFSATMPKSISLLANDFMKMPIKIEIAPQGTLAENIEQELFIVLKSNKMRLLSSVLQQHKNSKILIFSRTKHGAKRIARNIRSMGYSATEIHSNRSQAQRKLSLEGFTRNKFQVMVATDIAARGIDVRDIALVINFDLPNNSGDYVHRIGRTGRAGSHGKAISFVTPSEKANVRKIERLIRKSLPILSPQSLPKIPEEMLREEKSNTLKRHFNYRSRGKSKYKPRGHRNRSYRR